MPYCYDYPRPALTVDIALFAGDALLLIRRGKDPFKDHWALPGGFVDQDEDLPDAAARELREETGLNDIALHQFRAFGTPGRDPRGHTVSIVFMGETAAAMPQAGDDAADAGWFALDALPPLAFDHAQIIAQAVAARESTA